MVDVRKVEISTALEHSKRKSAGERFKFYYGRIRSIRVSAEERSCREGVHTARRSENRKEIILRLIIAELIM